MFAAAFPTLEQALAMLSRPDLLVGYRSIKDGDEFALEQEEAASFTARNIKTRRASGAARIVARDLMVRLGFRPRALPKGPTGAPIWPEGITGSLAHDDGIAVAAVTSARSITGVGIDLESAEALAADLMDLVVTPQERTQIGSDALHGKLLFTTKEAVYKAVHPLDGLFLEFSDIQVDLAGHKAITRNGRVVEIRFCTAADRTIALALT